MPAPGRWVVAEPAHRLAGIRLDQRAVAEGNTLVVAYWVTGASIFTSHLKLDAPRIAPQEVPSPQALVSPANRPPQSTVAATESEPATVFQQRRRRHPPSSPVTPPSDRRAATWPLLQGLRLAFLLVLSSDHLQGQPTPAVNANRYEWPGFRGHARLQLRGLCRRGSRKRCLADLRQLGAHYRRRRLDGRLTGDPGWVHRSPNHDHPARKPRRRGSA